jgi:hypothetical protein
MIRPSAFVLQLKTISGTVVQIRLTDMLAAGRPVVVSRTWQVIGSLAGVAMIGIVGLDLMRLLGREGRGFELVCGYQVASRGKLWRVSTTKWQGFGICLLENWVKGLGEKAEAVGWKIDGLCSF